MLQRYLLSSLLPTLLLTLLCTCVSAQTTIAVMDFDGTTPEMGIAGSVPFYNGGATAFFGIHNANGDDTDGTPTDTGVGATNRTALVTGAPISGDFFFIVDNNTAQNPTNFSTITLGPVVVTGLSDLLFSFDYRAFDYDGGEGISYQLDIDGTLTSMVEFVDGANGTTDVTMEGSIEIPIPDNTNSVSLIITVNQNAEDYVAFDNFIVTSDNPNLPCGVSSFGPTATETCAAFTNGTADAYTLSFDYTGVDAGGTLALLVNGAPATSFTNSGDDPTATAGGTIDISSPDLLEGTSYEVTFSDGGDCAYSVSGSVAANTCVSVCDLSTDISMLRLLCTSLSAGQDIVIGSLDYNGIEPGATAMISPGGSIINAAAPGTVEDGEINFGLLAEGGSYTITISGGACSGGDVITVSFTVPANLCQPSDLVINEVLANPTGGIDINMDGATNSDDEFIELYNNGTSDIDLSGYVVEEFAGARHTFASGTILAPGDGIMVIADTFIVNGVPLLTAASYGCSWVEAEVTFIGLNNTGTDGVIIRDASGNIVAQMSFTDAPAGASLALSPDGNLAGGYQVHTTVSSTGAMSSPCSENVDNSIGLPVELLSFMAQPESKRVVLTWSTTNETDNDRFVVERRTARNEWLEIGTVMAGRSTANNYEFFDENPVNGDNYYRLRQLDHGGDFALYGPVMATFHTTEFRVYPNPATTELRLGGAVSPTDRCSLIDANGRVVRELMPGADRVAITDLKPGVYLLRVARATGTETVRFVKR